MIFLYIFYGILLLSIFGYLVGVELIKFYKKGDDSGVKKNEKKN